MKQKRILIPTDGPESWKLLLAEPDRHWQPGFSAMSTALSWENADGLPNEITSLFRGAEDPALRNAELNIAIPEYKVDLAGGSRSSQNDVFALLNCAGGLIAVMVEGKAKEDFDETLLNWKKRTSPQGVEARLSDIAKHIGLTLQIPDHIRYQLLHRTASAVIEADRFHALYAAMVVQSFVADDSENHYNDFCEFLKLYGKEAIKNRLIELTKVRTCRLFAAWVYSNP
jgi:Domain of unknown function (DUF6946)